MNNFILLLKGEEIRKSKYGLSYANLGTAILFILFIQFIDIDIIDQYFPLFVFLDATIMAFLLIGVSMMFEKQENAIKTLFVTPISKHNYLLAKISSTVISSLSTLAILVIYGVLIKDLAINLVGITGAVILTTFVFACMGILFTYKSKDFTTLLMWLVAFNFLFLIPTVLQTFNIIAAGWFDYLQYINPTQAALTILNATAIKVEKTDLILSLSYLFLLAGVLYYLAANKFDNYSAKELGGE